MSTKTPLLLSPDVSVLNPEHGVDHPAHGLYRVRATVEYVVQARSPEDAGLRAVNVLPTAAGECHVHMEVAPLHGEADYPPRWDGDCIPYGAYKNTTTAEYLGDLVRGAARVVTVAAVIAPPANPEHERLVEDLVKKTQPTPPLRKPLVRRP